MNAKSEDEKDQEEVIFVPPSDALDVDESQAADSEKGELLTDEIKLEEQEIKSGSKSDSKGEIQLDSEENSGQQKTESEGSGQREVDPDEPDEESELEKKSKLSISRRSTVNKLETGIAAESEHYQISKVTESEDIPRLSVKRSSEDKEPQAVAFTESDDIPRLSVKRRSTDQQQEQAIATESYDIPRLSVTRRIVDKEPKPAEATESDDIPRLSVTRRSIVKESDQAIATEFDDKPRLSIARSSTDKQQPVTATKFDDNPIISIIRSSEDEESGKAIANESNDKPRLSVTRGSTDKESEQIIPFEPDEKPRVSVTRSSTDKQRPSNSTNSEDKPRPSVARSSTDKEQRKTSTESDGRPRLSAPRGSVVKEQTVRRSIIKQQEQGIAQDTRRVSVNQRTSVKIQELEEEETEPKRSSLSLERRRSSLRPPESKPDVPSGSKGFLSDLRRSTLKVPSQVKELLSELKSKVTSRAHGSVEDHEDQERGSTSELKRLSKGSFTGKSKEALASTSNNQDFQRKKSSVTEDEKSRKPSTSNARPAKGKAVEHSDTQEISQSSAKKKCSDSSSGCDIMSDFSDEVADMADSILDSFVVLESEPSSSLDIAYERIFGDITKGSALKQFVVGGGTGWFAGYLTHKVGKIAVITVAGALIAVQIAQYNGLIKVNWTKVNRALTKVRARARATMLRNRQRLSERVSVDNLLHATKLFYEENFFLASGFAGGFIFGFFM